MYQKLLNYFVLVIFVLLLAVPFVHAQTVPDPLQYTVSPETPGPNTQVTIDVEGIGAFLGNSTITWSENGKVISSGVGVRDFTFTTGGLGTQTKVHVEIDAGSEGTFTNDWTFSPSSVNMIWEADTSVPPMYKGKALYSGGSNLKVVAFPSIVSGGRSLSPGSLSYQWTVNDVPAPQVSGLARNSISFQGDQLQPQEDVTVTVYNGASQVGFGEVIIPATTPLILMYDKDPLRGLLLDTALPTALSLSAKEFTIQAVPYYFANSSLQSGAAAYAWTLNGSDTTGPNAAKGQLTLRQTGSGTGSAVIGVTIQNSDSDKLVQAAQTAMQIVFGGSSSSGSLFGI
ncbi:MAG TPA: hypothetical protein VN665_00835 [Candidatus Paceibacterota bacterium]|nr:hypothetical protein [Candidatus Paceibacterota bacterium]